ncbi:hypothetical protein BKA62DRAFT_695406 [Auriculariales sp. MPI-PUGE-AT-0066]|nr:hypothetical protein BKA62DRAFT_695406 [Auriculariales sp. MPI-PUGE-AT-0066]
MDALSMKNLASTLPQSSQQSANDLNAKFKDAALAITTLYRASTAAQKRAHDAGYHAALQDMLAFIRGGLSDGAVMDIGAIMDYAEARAAAVADEDDDDSGPTPPHPQPAPQPGVPPAKDKSKSKSSSSSTAPAAKENLPARSARRNGKRSSVSPSPPDSSLTVGGKKLHTHTHRTQAQTSADEASRASSPVIGTKRRHPATLTDGYGHPVGLGFGLQASNTSAMVIPPTDRIKKGKPKSSRVPNPPTPLITTVFGTDDSMDIEEERPRKRR